MAKKGYSGIIGYNPETGKTAIAYNGVRFYTKDKSVIKLAEKGDFEQAARRWAGKTSTARAIRNANKGATKPIYENPQRALFKKMFTSDKKERVGTSATERLKFAKEYRQTTMDINKYIDAAVTDKMPISEAMDRLPADLRQRIQNRISEEVEKAYAAKGGVDDQDIENIYDKVTMEMDDYLIENAADLDPEVAAVITDYTDMPFSEIEGLTRY